MYLDENSSPDSVDISESRKKTGSEYLETSIPNPIIILVGCKSEKRTSAPVFTEVRKRRKSKYNIKNDESIQIQPSLEQLEHTTLVTEQEGIKLARDIRAYKYMECCARNGEGVKEIFNEAISAVLNRRKDASIKRCVFSILLIFNKSATFFTLQNLKFLYFVL